MGEARGAFDRLVRELGRCAYCFALMEGDFDRRRLLFCSNKCEEDFEEQLSDDLLDDN